MVHENYYIKIDSHCIQYQKQREFSLANNIPYPTNTFSIIIEPNDQSIDSVILKSIWYRGLKEDIEAKLPALLTCWLIMQTRVVNWKSSNI